MRYYNDLTYKEATMIIRELQIFEQNLYKEMPALQNIIHDNCFIAGGSIASLLQNEPPKDFDIFFKSEEAVKTFMAAVDVYPNCIGVTKYSCTFYLNFGPKTLVQFIHFKAGNPDEITNAFDFNHTMNYYDFKTQQLVIKFSSPIKNKDLVINMQIERPISALMRMTKFLRRGYKIDNLNLSQLIIKVLSLDLSNPIDFNTQLKDLYGFKLKDVSAIDILTAKKPLNELEWWMR